MENVYFPVKLFNTYSSKPRIWAHQGCFNSAGQFSITFGKMHNLSSNLKATYGHRARQNWSPIIPSLKSTVLLTYLPQELTKQFCAVPYP